MADVLYDRDGAAYREASNGSKGSFSYADTSVYGARGARIMVAVPIPNPIFGGSSGSFPGAYVPGGGGGAKANKKILVGSRAVGYSPNGLVLVRLTRIT